MLFILPKMLKYIFSSNDMIFLVMYICVFNIVNTWGNSIVDLFYDSMKLFFNNHVKPWDDELKHIYTNPEKPVSPTLRTYWLFHLMIFGSQIPSFIPSFYKKFYDPQENPTAEEKEKKIIEIADKVLPQESEDRIESNIDKTVKGGANTPEVTDKIKKLKQYLKNDFITPENKIMIRKQLSQLDPDFEIKSKELQKLQKIERLKNNLKNDLITPDNKIMIRKQLSQLDPTFVAEEEKIKLVPELAVSVPSSNPELSVPLAAIPVAEAVPIKEKSMLAVGTNTASTTLNFLSGAKNTLTNILRFAISHYFVTVSGMSVSFYLLFYSFFGITHFSKLNLFETIFNIDNFVKNTSSHDYMQRCGIEARCAGTIWERTYDFILWIYHKAIQIVFKHLYVGSFFVILLSSLASFSTQITSSKELKSSLNIITIITGILIIIIYALKTFLFTKTSNSTEPVKILKETSVVTPNTPIPKMPTATTTTTTNVTSYTTINKQSNPTEKPLVLNEVSPETTAAAAVPAATTVPAPTTDTAPVPAPTTAAAAAAVPAATTVPAPTTDTAHVPAPTTDTAPVPAPTTDTAPVSAPTTDTAPVSATTDNAAVTAATTTETPTPTTIPAPIPAPITAPITAPVPAPITAPVEAKK
jgi:hypothetical protein